MLLTERSARSGHFSTPMTWPPGDTSRPITDVRYLRNQPPSTLSLPPSAASTVQAATLHLVIVTNCMRTAEGRPLS